MITKIKRKKGFKILTSLSYPRPKKENKKEKKTQTTMGLLKYWKLKNENLKSEWSMQGFALYTFFR